MPIGHVAATRFLFCCALVLSQHREPRPKDVYLGQSSAESRVWSIASDIQLNPLLLLSHESFPGLAD